MEARQLAEALLAARGSELDDPATRLALAQACVRAAVETEEHRDNPRLAVRRTASAVLIAAVAEDDPAAPVEEELLDHAVELGRSADRLVDLGPSSSLPGLSVVRDALKNVERPDGMAPLSDTDLISLAAAASRNAAVTARLELYPRDLDAKKALELAQVTGYLGDPGIEPQQLRDRVLARFPELTDLPSAERLRALLSSIIGRDIEVETDEHGVVRYVLPRHTPTSTSRQFSSGPTTTGGEQPREETLRRLLDARESGGFLAVKAHVWHATRVRDALLSLPDVTGVHVTDVFVRTLREIVAERGKPSWPHGADRRLRRRAPGRPYGPGRVGRPGLDADRRADPRGGRRGAAARRDAAGPLPGRDGAADAPGVGGPAVGRAAVRAVAAVPDGRAAQPGAAGRRDGRRPR